MSEKHEFYKLFHEDSRSHDAINFKQIHFIEAFVIFV